MAAVQETKREYSDEIRELGLERYVLELEVDGLTVVPPEGTALTANATHGTLVTVHQTERLGRGTSFLLVLYNGCIMCARYDE